jgi:hypothetical protein
VNNYFSGRWHRINDVIQVVVTISHPLASGSSLWGNIVITLPINASSNFTSASNVIGPAIIRNPTYQTVGNVTAVTGTNNQFRVVWNHTAGPTFLFLSVSLSYEV